jgi:hypothetical protein
MLLVLDRAHFDHMTGADRALQREVLGLFRLQVEGWIGAFTSGEGWREAVHTMKGSACEAAERVNEAEREAALARVGQALTAALSELEQFAAEAA